jgi:hypothetical protein
MRFRLSRYCREQNRFFRIGSTNMQWEKTAQCWQLPHGRRTGPRNMRWRLREGPEE